MKRWIKGALLIVVLAGVAAGAYRYLTREEVERVTVIEARGGTVEETVSATGAVEPIRTILVTTDPGTRVVAIYFSEQDEVRKGQVLATLDDTDLATQLSQHEANLQLLEMNLASAQQSVQRLRRLFEKGFAARQEVETAEQQVNVYRAQIEDRKLAMALVKAKQLRTVITAPVAGVVTRKFVVEGGILGDAPKGPGQAQPTVIAEIAELGSSEFHANVEQADIVKIRLFQKAAIRLDSFPDRVFQASAREIGLASVPDPTGRVRYQVKLRVDKPDGLLLKVGMSGTASFLLARKAQVVTLPPPVILQQGEDEFVFVLDKDRARLRKIKTGLHGEDMIEVVSGLEPGEQVIDQGRAKLRDGRRVELVNAKR